MATSRSRAGFAPRVRRLSVFCVAALLVGATQAPAAEEKAAPGVPWEVPFASDAGSLQKAAAALPPPEDKSFEILFRDVAWSLDGQGRAHVKDRTVVRLLTEAGVQSWSSIEQAWAPWYQQKPSMRARVIEKDGAAHELDPKTIAEGPAADADEDVYSDRRVARAPLPKLSAGAIVEEEFEIVETAPLLDAGVGHTVQLVSFANVRRVRLALTAPASVPLQWTVHGVSREAIHREETAGVVRLTYDGGPFAPFEGWEIGMPDDAKPAPLFSFSTGRSWREIATRYAAIVDERIAAGKADGLLRDAAGGAAAKGAPDFGRLLSRLHEHVRYTGVEFGDAAIVPAPPTETWKRGYGDCKDKAVLLVSLLRAAGARAHVALLSVGYGRDVDPALPGFTGFDHAIVVVEGANGKDRIWIDATDPSSRPGQIPESDQGRLALIASDDTRELVRIPKADAEANGVVETREFFLAESGNSRLVVTREPRGTREGEERSLYRLRARKDIQKQTEEHASSYFLARKVEKLQFPDPADLTKPFTVRFEAPDAGRGQTDASESAVAILPEEWALELSAFRSRGAEEDEAAAGEDKKDDKKKEKKRRTDFVWQEPFTNEWRYRVNPPDGYVSAGLPESSTKMLGPVRLTSEYAVEKSGVVTATIRLASGKERMTAAEFEAVRSEANTLAARKPFFIRFESVAGQHLAAGRIKEALAEYRRLIALHPKEALHREQMARALLQGSLGEAARRQARLAIENEPKRAAAHETLGWILQHDLLGRRFGKGFDREAAVAEYRKAIELDPKDKEAPGNLAILLEHDANGRRYGRVADIKQAVAEYQRIRRDLKLKSYDQNLAIALLRSEDFAEAKKVALELPPSASRDALFLTAVAAADGEEAAVREAGRLGDSTESRRAAIESAGKTLVALRRYEAAARLLTEAAGRSEKQGELLTQAQNVRRMKRYEEIPLPPDDPATLVKKLFLGVLLYGTPEAPPLKSLLTERLHTEDDSKTLESMRRAMNSHPGLLDIPPAVILDAVFPNLTIHKEGSDATGYRLSSTVPSAGNSFVLFASKEKGGWRLAASEEQPSAIGAEALARADAGDLEGARQWLDWARAELTSGGGDDPLGGATLRRFWTKGAKEGRAKVRIAAASLSCGEPAFAAAGRKVIEDAAAVQESGAAAEDVELAAADCDVSLKDWKDLEARSARLWAAHPSSDRAMQLRSLALMRLGKFAEVEKLANDRLAAASDDVMAFRLLIEARLSREDYAGAQSASLRLIERGRASQGDYNNLAWSGLFTKVTDETIEWALKGAGEQNARYAGGLHTLAAVYADIGRTAQAREALLESIRLKGVDEPESHDWYVLGRIAEDYGEMETARGDYARVEKPSVAEGGSTYILAQRRLAVIAPAAAPAAPARARK